MRISEETEPLVSVVMPVWNLAPVLPTAIDSVLSQTLDDLELIVVDDASTDATADVVEHYRRADSRVRVMRNTTNSRRSNIEWEPRNNGLQLARGAFIAYLDADNAWDPTALEVLVMKKERLVLRTPSVRDRDAWIDAFDDAIAFGASRASAKCRRC